MLKLALIMRSYPNINFSIFSIFELCDFVIDRIHVDITAQLDSIQKALSENDGIFFNLDQKQIFPVLFLQLKEECNQSIRLESLVFFPFIKSKILEPEFSIQEPLLEKLFGYQELIMALYSRIKLNLNNFLSIKQYTPIEQIIIHDLTKLEALLSDWIYLVQNNIINSIKKNTLKNELTK